MLETDGTLRHTFRDGVDSAAGALTRRKRRLPRLSPKAGLSSDPGENERLTAGRSEPAAEAEGGGPAATNPSANEIAIQRHLAAGLFGLRQCDIDTVAIARVGTAGDRHSKDAEPIGPIDLPRRP
jgi:hypothetical protein